MVGALPLGASNVAVINTTIKQNAKQAFKIALAAGAAEVILSYYALHCNMFIRDFFNNNMWVQAVIVLILLVIGSYLFFKKKSNKALKKNKLVKFNYTTGFLLGILNPPVLIYWIIAFGIINSNVIMLSFASSLPVLFLFFFGVYLGKIFTLYLYSRFSVFIKSRVQNMSLILNRVTGVLIVVIGLLQAMKLYIF